MTLYDYLEQASEFSIISKKFPAMVETAKEVEVIPWQDEYAIADHNPEQIDSLRFLDMLFQNKLISEDEYKERLNEFRGYASKTLAIAFNEGKKVAFRETPSIYTVVHELGHIHFQVNDLLWNTVYGGGEILLWLSIKGKYYITEDHIRYYHNLIKHIYEDPDGTHRFIAKSIAPRLNVYPHLFPICLFAGYIPSMQFQEKGIHKQIVDFFDDLQSEKWNIVPVEKEHLFSFLQNLTEGLKYKDPTWANFAAWLGIIEKCPTCRKLFCKCK